MHPAVERYLRRVLVAADLFPRDARAVRDELGSHLAFLEEAAAQQGLNEQEITAMLENEFGNPDDVGREIAQAKGHFRTWMKKKARSTAIATVVALVMAFGIRWQVAEAFTIQNASMAPAVPDGSWVLVNKWSSPAPGDLLVYRDDQGRNMIALTETMDTDAATVSKLSPSSAALGPRTIDPERIVGRVWLVSR